MGRHAGHLALRVVLARPRQLFLSQNTPLKLVAFCELLLARKNRGVRYSIVMVAEGALVKGADMRTLSGENRCLWSRTPRWYRPFFGRGYRRSS